MEIENLWPTEKERANHVHVVPPHFDRLLSLYEPLNSLNLEVFITFTFHWQDSEILKRSLQVFPLEQIKNK